MDRLDERKSETQRTHRGDRREGFASVHVDELVEAFMLATLNENAIGQVFNVVNPNTFVTYYEIAQHVVKKAGSKSKIRVVKSSELVNSTPTSSEKIQKILGWKPWITRTEAINPKTKKLKVCL